MNSPQRVTMNSKRRILVADDDAGIVKMTKFRLEHEGFEVITASDGEEALHQADAALPIHLILLDVRMPKLNGYQVCQQLKHRPATAQIPVIIFSVSEQQLETMADRCIEVGASDWIQKPFRTRELMDKIHHALEEGGRRIDG